MKKMKYFLSFIMVLILGCSILTSCGREALSGVYVADALVAEGTLEFDKEGNVTYMMNNIVGGEKEYNGKYEIDEKAGTISLNFDTRERCILSGSWDFTKNSENQTITIGQITYKKQQ